MPCVTVYFCVNYYISGHGKDQIKVCSNLNDFTKSSAKFNWLLIFKHWRRLVWLHGPTSWKKCISKCISKLCGYSCILNLKLNCKAIFKSFLFFQKIVLYWNWSFLVVCSLFSNPLIRTIFTKKNCNYSSQHKNWSIIDILMFRTLFGDVRKFTWSSADVTTIKNKNK